MEHVVVGWEHASVASGWPVRSLRRMVEKGKLTLTKDGHGRCTFERADLQALATTEGGPAGEPAAEPAADPATGPPSALAAPDLPVPRTLTPAAEEALVFRELEAGSSIAAIVVQHEILADRVLEVHAKWRMVKEADLSAPSVPRELADLRCEVKALRDGQKQAEERWAADRRARDARRLDQSHQVDARQYRQRVRLDAVEKRLARLEDVVCGLCDRLV